METPRSCGLSIAGMVLGIVGLVCCGIPGIVGFILSIIGFNKDREAGAPTGMAIAGIVTSGICVFGWAIYIFIIGGSIASLPFISGY